MRVANRRAYLKKVGKLSRCSPLENTEERKLARNSRKAALYVGRAKRAKRIDELTKFITAEAHDLRILRNNLIGIEWHVDHIIPLKGELVSGLHVWNNLRVIPKILNLRKGNKIAFHDQWKTGLQEGIRLDQENGRRPQDRSKSSSEA